MTQTLSSDFYGEPLTEPEQIAWLQKAKKTIEANAFMMKRKLDEGNLPDALEFCTKMLNELRTSTLSPKRYYELYMSAFDELKFLEWWIFEERDKRGKKLSELYETVQYASSVLPRLYLLITVGSAYIRSGEVEAKDVLRDLVEMCRGVQHPTRGIFLRNFLSEMMKTNLPDVDESSIRGDVRDSIDFILVNFTEMNKLWVRLQQGPAHEKQKREADRLELRTLVGKNLARLSQLDGVDCNMYSTSVMPRVFNQIVKCHDKIAQQYLIEIVIQIFPDEYHLATLSTLLSTFSKLDSQLDVRPLLVDLIERLNRFVQKDKATVPSDMDIYKVFADAVQEIATETELKLGDFLLIQASLLRLAMTMYGSKYVDEICRVSAERIEKQQGDKEKCVQEVLKLLSIPLEEGHLSPIEALSMPNYTRLSSNLVYHKLKTIQSQILKSLLAQRVVIKTEADLVKILTFISTLLGDADGEFEGDDEDMMLEQNLVCGMVHAISCAEPKAEVELLAKCLETFKRGGEKRLVFTMPTLAFACMRLAQRIFEQNGAEQERTAQLKSVYQLVNGCIGMLSELDTAVELSLRLYVQAAVSASNTKMPGCAYDLFASAIGCYEERIADSQAKYNALLMLVATVRFIFINREDYTTLVTTVVKHCGHLLKKADQSRVISMAAHVFWREGEGDRAFLDDQRVLECLQRSLKMSEQVNDALLNASIRIDILNRYLYFFDHKNSKINGKYISGMVDLTNTVFTKGSEDSDSVQTYLRNTLAYIQMKKKDPATEEQYKDA